MLEKKYTEREMVKISEQQIRGSMAYMLGVAESSKALTKEELIKDLEEAYNDYCKYYEEKWEQE